MRVGVVNWDASLPPDSYFGGYQTRNLSPAKYRAITPFYADVLGENRISYHLRTQDEYDRELLYAIGAGIDYFAYVWYPEEGSRAHITTSENDCSAHVHELAYARRMHCASALREKIGVCAIVSTHPFTDSDIDELVQIMREPYYEKIGGRPLLYIYRGCRADIIGRIRATCVRMGVSDPYVAAMYSSVPPASEDLSACEALSAYNMNTSGITTYAELFALSMEHDEARRTVGKAVIPMFTTGWDPSPRIDQPSPWIRYPDEAYPVFASGEELAAGARALAAWIRDVCREQFVGHVLSFAWNEFEEGGIICPTLDAAGMPDTRRLRDFAAAADILRTACNPRTAVL